MNFSTKGRYGLRAMIDLAVHSEEAVPISSIAARENISECYLEQLAAKLKKAGLVVSTRGAQGGYRLARPSSEISVAGAGRQCECGGVSRTAGRRKLPEFGVLCRKIRVAEDQ